MVMLGIVTVGVVRGVPKMFRPPICRAHCAVIFAIAQLSCFICMFKVFFVSRENRTSSKATTVSTTELLFVCRLVVGHFRVV